MDYVQKGGSIQTATNKAYEMRELEKQDSNDYGAVGGSLATNPPEPVNMIYQNLPIPQPHKPHSTAPLPPTGGGGGVARERENRSEYENV